MADHTGCNCDGMRLLHWRLAESRLRVLIERLERRRVTAMGSILPQSTKTLRYERLHCAVTCLSIHRMLRP
jgi:hypothetical protein